MTQSELKKLRDAIVAEVKRLLDIRVDIEDLLARMKKEDKENG